jgi:ankyrin repeat protein
VPISASPGAVPRRRASSEAKGRFFCSAPEKNRDRASRDQNRLTLGGMKETGPRSGQDAALIKAVTARDLSRVLRALESGASARALRERDGWSALHVAALSGDTAIAKILIDGGAELNATAVTREVVDRSVSERLVTPLLLALSEENEQMATLLVDRGAAIEHESAPPGEALSLAVTRRLERVVVRLLARSKKPKWKNVYGQSLLVLAVSLRHTGIVKRLLAAGAPVDPEALGTACARGHLGLVKLLLEAGARVNAPGASESPLEEAASSGQTKMVKWLLEHGATLKKHGAAALHGAANGGHAQTLRYLIEQGVAVNGRDRYGWTPLMTTAWYGHVEAAKLLLSAGADPSLETSDGKTALQMARERSQPKVASLLEAAEKEARSRRPRAKRRAQS